MGHENRSALWLRVKTEKTVRLTSLLPIFRMVIVIEFLSSWNERIFCVVKIVS